MTVTNEQFAAALAMWEASDVAETSADAGRAMLAALQAHGCIEKPGLSVRQELAARMYAVTGVDSLDDAVFAADFILALGDTK